MPDRQARLHAGRQGDARVGHAERFADARAHQGLVAHAGAERQHVAQKADAQVGVFVLRADVAGEVVAGEEIVHLLDGVIGIGVGWVFRSEVRGHARQA